MQARTLALQSKPSRDDFKLGHHSASGNLYPDELHLLRLIGKYPRSIFRDFIRRVVMNLNRIFSTRKRLAKIALGGLLLVISITACKARASNPALNFAPVPDVAPQN